MCCMDKTKTNLTKIKWTMPGSGDLDWQQQSWLGFEEEKKNRLHYTLFLFGIKAHEMRQYPESGAKMLSLGIIPHLIEAIFDWES